ncbi:MAG: type pantothenate kinase [Phycisphaerales bacterium]|jgi:type III pantothenate kinase|nr:type pantothenate kinase [Phycisphaerales bacterium]MEA2736574.1 type pantothenate kinase [Humisphaera sp.]
MDINLLVLNVGNSRLSIGVFVAGELQYSTRVPHGLRNEWPARISEAWEKLGAHDEPAVVGASVNPPLVESLEHAVKQATGQDVQWVGPDIDLPIKVLTDEPEKTGVDRVLNVAAAYEQMGKACVVVDAGTAVTVDVCNDEGHFLGGAIAPGAQTQLDALHEKTARLPRVELAAPKHPIGKSTAEAIQLGVFHGIRGAVKELVEGFATEQGTWPDIIATGGDSALLFENWELVHAIAPDLTLYGIALAFTNHHIKHGE